LKGFDIKEVSGKMKEAFSWILFGILWVIRGWNYGLEI
jgi:hypothetical protein